MDTQNKKGKKASGILTTAAVIGISVILSKALGLLRDILIAAKWGTGAAAVAYDTASRIPIILFDLVIGGAVSTSLIPVLKEVTIKRDRYEAERFSSSYISLIAFICTVIAVIGIVFAEELMSVMAPGVTNEAKKLAVHLTRIMFPSIIFTGIAFSFTGILQSMGEFRVPSLISIVSNSVAVLYLYTLSDTFGITGLAVGMLIGWASQAIIQLPKLYSLGWKYRIGFSINNPYVKKAAKNAVPILLGTWTQPICSLINTRFASGINGGSAITALGYANRLYAIASGIFVFVCTNLIFPNLAEAVASGNRKSEEQMIIKAAKAVVFITAPLSAGIVVLAPSVISVIYERGVFTPHDTSLTATALVGYSIGMVFFGINEISVKAFFAEGNTKVPMISSILSMAFNIAAVPIFAKKLGIGGIALASSVATAMNFAINFTVTRRNHKGLFRRHDAVDIVKSVGSAVIMGTTVRILSNYFSSHAAILAICVPAGISVYFFLTSLFHSDEIAYIKTHIKRSSNKSI